MSSITNITRQSSRLLPQTVKQVSCFSTSATRDYPIVFPVKEGGKPIAARFVDFQKRLRVKTPNWNELSRHPLQELDSFKPWPKGVNPYTGEGGGPTGPEPTRYGDWERRGRCSDF